MRTIEFLASEIERISTRIDAYSSNAGNLSDGDIREWRSLAAERRQLIQECLDSTTVIIGEAAIAAQVVLERMRNSLLALDLTQEQLECELKTSLMFEDEDFLIDWILEMGKVRAARRKQ